MGKGMVYKLAPTARMNVRTWDIVRVGCRSPGEGHVGFIRQVRIQSTILAYLILELSLEAFCEPL